MQSSPHHTTPKGISMLKTTVRLALGLAAASLMSLASAATTNFAGSLSATDPTFNRPLSGTPPGGLSGVGTAVSYDLYPFYVTASASFTLQTLSANLAPGTADDTFIVLYQTAFNPLAPLTNAIAADDDTGVGSLSLITTALNAGVQYYLVSTSFANGAFGGYDGNISATGAPAAILGMLPVPEPSSALMMLAGLGVAGLLVARRRRV
jgi:PEP-CTERM motif